MSFGVVLTWELEVLAILMVGGGGGGHTKLSPYKRGAQNVLPRLKVVASNFPISYTPHPYNLRPVPYL